ISIFDTMLSLFMVLAVTCFYRAIEASRALRRDGKALPGFSPRSWSALAWGAVAAGVLTKGPVALAVPLLVAVPYAAWRKEWRPIWNPWGLLVFVALVAPWLVAVERQEPGFLHYALVIETWKRLTTDEMRRTGPVWYFVPYLMGGAFPWSIVAAAGWLRSRTERSGAGDARHRWVFLALWLALPFLLFSFSQSKRPQYILPLIPALTITVAGLWSGRAEPDDESPRSSSFLPGKVAASVVFMILGAALTLAGVAMDSEAFGVDGSILPLARRSAIVLGLFCLAGGFGAWRSRRWTTAVIGLSAPVILFPLAVGPLVSAVADSRSSRHLAELVRSQPEGSGSVAVFEHFPLSLPFYLGHTVDFVTEDAVALRSGFVERSYAQLLARPHSTLRDHDWWYRTVAACPSPYVLLVPERYQDQMAILEASGRENLGGDEEMSVFGPCRQRLRPAPEETGGREE
ncbi:MAG: phospholipid carrier-dependent glycosyltransferase, partial [Acidobacteria bacterium]|nr:phospholipid carrier-dependent glycosyltransferase [Acidobacteriota bacterium]